jgi:pimeloyl-ACP methyl ester carboxylesterase
VVAWKAKPSWFVVTADDRVVSVDLQAASAKRMNAKTTIIHASHMSILSRPRDVAAVIGDAVAATSPMAELASN